MRADAFGFFWNDVPEPAEPGKRKVERGPRPIPPIPDTGWAPRDFPRLGKASVIGLDIESKDLDLDTKGPGVRRDGHIIGLSVATEDGGAWYFPMRHEMGDNLDPEAVTRWAKDNLTRPRQPKVGANLLYDLDYLAHAGVEVAGPFYDVQVAEALLDENRFTYALEQLSQDYLGHGKVDSDLEQWALEAYGNKNFRAELYRCPPALVGPYAEGDARIPLLILKDQLKRMKAEDLLRVWDIECRIIPALLAMRRRGVRVDLDRAKEVEDELEALLKQDEAELARIAGFPVDPDTKDHLIRLFDKLAIEYPRTKPSKKYPGGQPSFTKEFLEHSDHPVAQKIVAVRKWRKFLDVFIRSYIYDMNIDGRIHCLFNATRSDEYGTVSGRLSSSMPNLQNIPARDEVWGPRIRSIFVPDGDDEWAKLDWSQIEYRFLVDCGKGKSADLARKMYRTNPKTDFHQWVSEITHVPRRAAKNINFGLVYGMGKGELARQLGLPLEEAEPMFSQYHTNMSFVRDVYESEQERASQNGYITTVLGRRRRFHLWQPRWRSNEGEVAALPKEAAAEKWSGERLARAFTHKALNGRIQGSAADLMKLALAELYESSGVADVLGCPLLIVHDEYDYSKPRTREANEAIKEVKRIMETCLKISVPIIADLTIGENWGACK